MSDKFWILFAFGCYLLIMILIGLFYYRKTQNSADYFLGGRS